MSVQQGGQKTGGGNPGGFNKPGGTGGGGFNRPGGGGGFNRPGGGFNKGGFKGRFVPRKEAEHRINNFIRVPQVRLVGENVEVGIYNTQDALRMAQEQQLDLVEISPTADPPVCKIIDYNKFLYDKKKKEKERRKRRRGKQKGKRGKDENRHDRRLVRRRRVRGLRHPAGRRSDWP